MRISPDPDPNASTELAPSADDIAAANEQSGREVLTQFEQSVRNLTSELEAASAARRSEAAYTPPTPVAPVAAEVLTPDKLTQIATDHGFGPAAVKLVEQVIGPMVGQTIANQARQALRDLARDPVYGPVYRKNETAIKQYMKDHNINDAYIASNGGEDILKVVAFEDLADARAAAKAAEAREKEGKSALGTTGTGRPRSEGVQTGPVGAPAGSVPAANSDVERAASLKVNPKRVTVARERFGMSESELRTELLDMVKWEEKLGTEFVEKNGLPICELADVMPTIGGVKVVPKEYFG